MEAFKETKRLMLMRTVVIAVTVSVLFLASLGFVIAVWLGALRMVQ